MIAHYFWRSFRPFFRTFDPTLLLLIMGYPRPLYHLFLVFFKQTIQFIQQINVKNVMYIRYPAPGLEPTTFRTWVSSHNHLTTRQKKRFVVAGHWTREEPMSNNFLKKILCLVKNSFGNWNSQSECFLSALCNYNSRSSVDSSAPSILPPQVWIPSHHLCYFQFEFKLWHVEKTKINRKRGRDWPIFKKLC